MTTTRVSLLSVTPVKGLALHHPESVNLSTGGVEGDRALFFIDDAGELISCTELGDLMRYRAEYDPVTGVLDVHGPDGLVRSDVADRGETARTDFYGMRTVTGHVASGWGALFSDIAGRSVRLVVGDSGGYDVAGLTLLGLSSVEALAAANEAGSVDARRFRMNVEISGAAPNDEDLWSGRELRLGAAVVRVGGPVKRCAATTRNPDTGVVDLQTLRMIGTYRGRQETAEFGRGFYFGVYADVVTPGRVQVGDEVALIG